jgi:Protein of unknown function (DUF3500)
VIEFDETQDNANHIHSVWRDLQGDFTASAQTLLEIASDPRWYRSTSFATAR